MHVGVYRCPLLLPLQSGKPSNQQGHGLAGGLRQEAKEPSPAKDVAVWGEGMGGGRRLGQHKAGGGGAATDVAILLRASRYGPRPLTASTLMRASHKRLPQRQQQHPAHVGSDTELTRGGTKVPFMIHCDVFPARLDPWGPGAWIAGYSSSVSSHRHWDRQRAPVLRS